MVSVTNGKKKDLASEVKIALGLIPILLRTKAVRPDPDQNLLPGGMAEEKGKIKVRVKAKIKVRVKARARAKKEVDPLPALILSSAQGLVCPLLERRTNTLARPT